MKTKYIIAILFTAVVTLSFTFISTSAKVEKQVVVTEDTSAPVGGIAADDSF